MVPCLQRWNKSVALTYVTEKPQSNRPFQSPSPSLYSQGRKSQSTVDTLPYYFLKGALMNRFDRVVPQHTRKCALQWNLRKELCSPCSYTCTLEVRLIMLTKLAQEINITCDRHMPQFHMSTLSPSITYTAHLRAVSVQRKEVVNKHVGTPSLLLLFTFFFLCKAWNPCPNTCAAGVSKSKKQQWSTSKGVHF